MEVLAFLISVGVLIAVIMIRTEIKELKKENKLLKNMIQSLVNSFRGPPQHPAVNNQYVQQIQNVQQNPVVQQSLIQNTAEHKEIVSENHIQETLQPSAIPVQNPAILMQVPVNSFNTHNQQNKNVSNQPKQSDSQKKKNIENIFGKNVIGMIAAILMFIGLVAFGTLIFTKFTDSIKVVSMFLASFAVAGTGLFLTIKNKTAFSEILTGCGMGMAYISIFLTNIYFGLISGTVAFSLIFLWSIAVLLFSKKLKIKSLAYIALCSCAISSIFALASETNEYVGITVYHILTFALLVFANKEDKVLFKISSASAIILNTALGNIIVSEISSYFNSIDIMNSDMHQYLYPNEIIMDGINPVFFWLNLLLVIYNIAIFIYASRETIGNKKIDSIVSNALMGISLMVTFYSPLIETILPEYFSENTLSVILLSVVAVGLCLIQVIYQIFVKSNTKRTILFLSLEALAVIMVCAVPLYMPNGKFILTMIFAIINLLVYKKLKERNEYADVVYWSGFGILLLDTIISLSHISALGVFGFVYSIALMVLANFYMKEKYGNMMQFPLFQFLIFNIHFFGQALMEYEEEAVLPIAIIVVIFNILYTLGCSNISTIRKLLDGTEYIKTEIDELSDTFIEIAKSIFITVCVFFVHPLKEFSFVGSFILSVLLIILALTNFNNVIKSKDSMLSVWTGIKFTLLTFLTGREFLHLTDYAFVVSLFLLVIAAICIVFGFVKDLKSLRIYGLVVIMCGVFKLAVLDIWDQNSIFRVLALIAGGAICFAISAIYSKIEKQQQKKIT